jgi:hypothetical protein
LFGNLVKVIWKYHFLLYIVKIYNIII